MSCLSNFWKERMGGLVKVDCGIGTHRSSEVSPGRERKQGKDGRSYAWTAQRLLELEKEVEMLKKSNKVVSTECWGRICFLFCKLVMQITHFILFTVDFVDHM